MKKKELALFFLRELISEEFKNIQSPCRSIVGTDLFKIYGNPAFWSSLNGPDHHQQKIVRRFNIICKLHRINL